MGGLALRHTVIRGIALGGEVIKCGTETAR